MTISKGSPYGTPNVSLPLDAPVCVGDAGAADAVVRGLAAGSATPVVGLVGGDLCRTLGGRPAGTPAQTAAAVARLNGRAHDAAAFPVDLLVVRLDDGDERIAVAHVVARNRTWTRVWAVGNAAWLGGWNPWPRAHPGDAKADLIDATLRLGDVLKVRARLPLGAHMPHPSITERRRTFHAVDFGRRLDVWIDGRRAGPATRIDVTLRPDAITVYV